MTYLVTVLPGVRILGLGTLPNNPELISIMLDIQHTWAQGGGPPPPEKSQKGDPPPPKKAPIAIKNSKGPPGLLGSPTYDDIPNPIGQFRSNGQVTTTLPTFGSFFF